MLVVDARMFVVEPSTLLFPLEPLSDTTAKWGRDGSRILLQLATLQRDNVEERAVAAIT